MDNCSRFHCYDYPWQATIPKILMHLKYELNALKNVSVTSHQHTSKQLTVEAKFMIFIISIFLMLAAIGTTITVYDIFNKPQKKRRRSSDGDVDIKKDIHSHREQSSAENSEMWLMKFKIFSNCFCIYTNGRRILSTVPNEGDILWLNGIRSIGTIWVMAIHGTFLMIGSLSNLNELKPWLNSWLMSLLLNGTTMISLFFVLGGFLNGYFTSHVYIKRGGISWLRFYQNRILRIAPLYAMIMGFYAVLFPYLSSGPVWPTYGTNPVCKDYWWWNLFFINNLQPSLEQCFVPAWYLAADMQFHLISPLFLVLLLKKPRFGYGLVFLILCASCCYRCIMTIKYGLFYNLSSFAHYMDDWDLFNTRFWNYTDLLHSKPFTNLGAYLIGLGLGHHLWKRETSKKERNNMLTLCCGWIGFVISMWICFDVLYFSEESVLKRVFFNGFSDVLVSCSSAWIIYVCATKQGGFMSRLLSIKLFLPLSRISFAAYLINFIVIIHYFLSSTKQEAFNMPSMIIFLFHVVFWTYIASFIASLFVEVPMSRVLRLFRFI